MPELPEVETMARDLAPLVDGATITGAWWDWAPVIRHPAPAAFERAIMGRRVLRVGRRAKWLVLDLSEDAVLAIQLGSPSDAARWRIGQCTETLDRGVRMRQVDDPRM
mgnify:CR=1 FL=1